MASSPSVSLTMIVKNEASNLEACIAPLSGVFDEIVVCDTGSTDGTVAIAERLGARVVHFSWCDSFSAARNHAIENATGDFIFILDADDRVPPPELVRLRELCASLEKDRNVAYTLRCVSLAIDGGVGVDMEQVRLFRRRPDVRWRYRVHEQIAPSVHESGATIKPTGIRIAHVGYRDPGLVDAKTERNLRLIELDLADRPGDPFLATYRAIMLTDSGRNAEAIVGLSMCAPFVPPHSDMGRTIAMALARALRAENQLADALETVRASRRACPDDDVALAVMEAEILIQIADLSGAGAVLASVASEAKAVLANPDLRARALLAEVLVSLGRLDAAEAVARALTESRPSFGPAWLALADVLYARGELKETRALRTKFASIRGGEAASVILESADLLHEGRIAEARAVVEAARVDNPSALLAQFHQRMMARADLTPPLVSCLGSPWPEAAIAIQNTGPDLAGPVQLHFG